MRYALIVCGALLGLTAMGETAARPNCAITIRTIKSDGQKSKLTFHTLLHSPQECAELARLHKTNFDRDTIQKKTVTFQWDR